MAAQAFTSLLWNQITDGSAVVGTAEAAIATSPSIAGSGAGTVADGSLSSFWFPGKAIRIWVAFRLTTAGSAEGNITFTFRLDTTGGTSIAASAAVALAASQSNITGVLEGILVCRSIGAAGSIMFVGTAQLSTAETTNVVMQIPASAPATAAIDTTAAHQILLDVTLGSASDSITVQQFLGYALN
jgi:hypothetical protein